MYTVLIINNLRVKSMFAPYEVLKQFVIDQLLKNKKCVNYVIAYTNVYY
jgi:hypothetical protein